MANSAPGGSKPSRAHLNRRIRDLRGQLDAEQHHHARTARKLERAKKRAATIFTYQKRINDLEKDLATAEETMGNYREELAGLRLKCEQLEATLNEELGKRLDSKVRVSGGGEGSPADPV